MHQTISEQFEELGIKPTEEILDKCVELCFSYKITDAVEFVEQWMAYSISHLNGTEPTISYLLEFERKDLANMKKKANNTESLASHNSTAFRNSAHFNSSINSALVDCDDDIDAIALYGGLPRADNVMNYGNGESKNNEIDEMDSYTCKTPKAIKSIVHKTPGNRHHDIKFSPASYSPVYGTPKHEQVNSGKILYTYGNSNFIKDATWSANTNLKIEIKNILMYENQTLSSKAKYLFDNLLEKVEIAGDLVFERGKEICKKYFGPDATDYFLEHPTLQSSEPFKTVGTIYCEHEGDLDKYSVILVGSDDNTLHVAPLNFNTCKPFSAIFSGIFSGQTVLINGTNPRGKELMVEEIYTEKNLKLSHIPKMLESISFVIAAGPYTSSDDLVYDPLSDLIAYCKENKPNVLILIGPFMDTEHTMISGNVIAEKFESYFGKIISGIVNDIGTEVQICVVASHRDAHSDMVYPTPPINFGKHIYPNVHLLPDPCIIDVNGLELGLTSTDIFEHLLNNELICNPGDKVKRIANYLFHQGSFYPLSPPADGVCFDSNLASKFARLDKLPNILVLPSNDKIFIRDVNGCLIINPGRVTKIKGGTFTRLKVNSTEDKEKLNLLDFMACQILKV